MSQIIFRGVTIEKVEEYCSTGGQVTQEIHCEAGWSKPVCSEMGWTEEPQGFGNGSLDGQLAATSMMCEPNGKDLKDRRFDIGVDTVGSFKHKAKVKDGDVVDRSLTFIVKTTAEDAYEVLHQWLKYVGPSDSKAVLTVKYNANQQTTIADAIGDAEPPAEKPRGRKRDAEAVQ